MGHAPTDPSIFDLADSERPCSHQLIQQCWRAPNCVRILMMEEATETALLFPKAAGFCTPGGASTTIQNRHMGQKTDKAAVCNSSRVSSMAWW